MFLMKLLQVRNALLYRPDDHNKLWQQPPQRTNILPGYDEMKGYRYPAPGSVPRPNITVRMEDPYDNKRFSRDLNNLEDDVSVYYCELRLYKIDNECVM